MSRKRTLTLLAGPLSLALAAGACGSGEPTSGNGGPGAALPPASGSLSLQGVCPDTVVVQTNWFPESEHGGIYQLVGSGYTLDAGKKRLTGPLVSAGRDTGVRIEIRAGGPAVGFQSNAALMYQDSSITLGMVQSDEIVQFSKSQPVIGVLAPMELDPTILLWDPKAHPDWHTIADIGRTNTKVMYYQGDSYMDYLTSSGILRRNQVDGSYDGSPSAFVASGGTIAVEGYATDEPYTYQHEVKAWGRPVAYQLISETGYPSIANILAVRTDRLATLAPCLRRLIPIIQQGQVDFMNNPDKTTDLILKADDAYKGGFVYSQANAHFAVDQMRQLGIIGNGKDSTLGNFDTDRIQRLISILAPIFTERKKAIKPDLTPDDIGTNEFINPAIGLKS
jgi:hypothetical protein